MSDLRETILAAEDRPYEDVDVEEWGVTVRIRGLTGKAAEDFARRFGTTSGDGEQVAEGIMADLLVRTLEDPETGEPIFGEDDADALSEKAGGVIARLFWPAQELSGLGDLERAKNA